MDPETGYVDNLFEKPRNRVRRGYGKTARGTTVRYKNRIPGFNPTVIKVVKGDAVSKNQTKYMSNFIFEDLAPEVFYSLKKKNRWEKLDSVDVILNTVNEDSPSFTVSAMERNPKGHLFHGTMHDKEIRVYGRVKGGSGEVEKIALKSGNGAPLLSLEDSLECRKEKKTKKKRSEKEVKPREPEVTLIIDPQGDVQKLPAINFEEYEISRRGPKYPQKCNKFHGRVLEKEKDDCLKTDEESFDEFEEEIQDKEESKTFQLSDFVKSPAQKKGKIRKKKIQDIEFLDEIPAETIECKTHEQPIHEYELLKNVSFFSKIVDICSYFPKATSFTSKLEQWYKYNSSISDIIWMNKNKTKCLIDFSEYFKPGSLAAFIGLTILEDNKSLKMTFNTDFIFEYSEKELPKFSEYDKEHFVFFRYITKYMADISEPVLKKRKNFSHFKETFQYMSDECVECFTDRDLLNIFSKAVKATTHSHSSHSNSVKFCKHKNFEESIELSCSHSLCIPCAKLIFRNQILNHSEELTCPVCDSIQDPLRLTFAIPVPLIRAFLKDKFRRQSKNGIGECPECSGYFEIIPGVSVINCKRCCIAFCQDCFLPPHFPISCDQMRIWFPNFEHQYKSRHLNKVPQYGHCICGNYFEFPIRTENDYSSITCRDCHRYYYLNQEGVWVQYFYYQYHQRFKIVDASEIHTYIIKPFFESYLDIRNDIEDQKRVSEMKRFGKDFVEDRKVREFIKLRFKALKLIEYGTVWLYFERKNQGSGKNKEVSKILKKLRFLIDSIIGQIANKSGANVLEDIKSLQESYSKAVTMF